MVSDIRYRMFFNNDPWTDDQLERVQEITVEQEVDMAWQAHIKIPIFADETGKWTAEDEDFMAPYSRVRVEIRIDNNQYVPLIEGPIVGFDSQMSHEPGQSSITLIIQDDSVLLDRVDSVAQFENLKDVEIAMEIFNQSRYIGSTDIADIPSNVQLPVVIQHGTCMQLLKLLARRHRMHAYVLPGREPEKSIGCFKSFPTHPDGLEPLVLLGENQNIVRFSVRNQAFKPSDFSASQLNISDKNIRTAKSSFRDAELMGTEPALAGSADGALQILRSNNDFSRDLDMAVSAEATNSSYSFEATGEVDSSNYPSILQPYRVVTVIGVNGRLSGDYLISKVTHKLTDSEYSQSFTLRRNARSAGSGSTGRDGSGAGSGESGIGISGSISLGVHIF